MPFPIVSCDFLPVFGAFPHSTVPFSPFWPFRGLRWIWGSVSIKKFYILKRREQPDERVVWFPIWWSFGCRVFRVFGFGGSGFLCFWGENGKKRVKCTVFHGEKAKKRGKMHARYRPHTINRAGGPALGPDPAQGPGRARARASARPGLTPGAGLGPAPAGPGPGMGTVLNGKRTVVALASCSGQLLIMAVELLAGLELLPNRRPPLPSFLNTHAPSPAGPNRRMRGPSLREGARGHARGRAGPPAGGPAGDGRGAGQAAWAGPRAAGGAGVRPARRAGVRPGPGRAPASAGARAGMGPGPGPGSGRAGQGPGLGLVCLHKSRSRGTVRRAVAASENAPLRNSAPADSCWPAPLRAGSCSALEVPGAPLMLDSTHAAP